MPDYSGKSASNQPSGRPEALQAEVIEAAKKARAVGISVCPPEQDETKRPLADYRDDEGKPTWKPLQSDPADDDRFSRWYGPRTGIGWVCGAVSSGLCVIDYDTADAYERYVERAAEWGLAELVERLSSGYLGATPSGGHHLPCFNDEVRGCCKLAMRPGKKPNARDTIIELKAEGGFIIEAPTYGRVHPSGKPYERLRGSIETIATVNGEEFEALMELARSFDEMPKAEARESKPKGRPPTSGLRPGDDYADRHTWTDILETAGWKAVSGRGEETFWRRPGKSIGFSASTNYAGNGGFYVWSTSTEFEIETTYTKFGVYAHLHHEGDHSAAARALGQQGYGQKTAASSGQYRRTGTDGTSYSNTEDPAFKVVASEEEESWQGKDSIPQIVCGSESPFEGLKTWTPAAMAALGEMNDPPRLFQRSGKMMRIKAGEDDMPPSIESLSLDALRGEMDRSATWGTEYFDKKGNSKIRYGPPRLDVMRDVASLPGWDHNLIPRLDSVVETPRFLADGTLLRTPGYNATARLYYAPSEGMDSIIVPDRPSVDDVKWSKSLILDDLLFDFTFANQASRAAAVAFTLLPFVRALIQGPTPNHHFGASTEGTGKTLALIATSYPSLQREVNLSPQKEDEAEWRKALTSFFMSGMSHFAVDNLANTLSWDGDLRPVDSHTLAMAWTVLYYTDRKLGGNDEARIKVQTVFASTGNNTNFSRELTRRVVPIDLVAACENPSLRTGFKHDPLLEEFVEPRRLDLLRACLIICQHWLAEGRPMGGQTFGRFESYARVMGGILDSIEVPGFLENRSKMIGRNPEATRWGALAEAWAAAHGSFSVSCSHLWATITENPDLHVAFADVLGDGKDLSQKQRLGKALEKQINQVWLDWRITRSTIRARNGTAVYRLKAASEPYFEAEADDDSDVTSEQETTFPIY